MEQFAKILDDIRKTGFVTELIVGSTLKKKGWHTYHSESYIDKDSGKSREIDIIATKVYANSESKIHVELTLVIEIKKMKQKPWVVFCTKKNSFFYGWRILHTGFNNHKKGSGSVFQVTDLEKNNFRNNNRLIGNAFHEAFKKPDEPSKVYESLISATKAAIYQKEISSIDNNEDFDCNEETELHIFIPLVVLDGELYSVILDDAGEVILSESEYIQILLNYSSPNYGDLDNAFLPDLVKQSYLDNYLDQTETWFNTFTDSFSKRLSIIRKKGCT